MSITSVTFILFLLATVILYYLIPGKHRWLVLLASSMFFYMMSGISNGIYILITALSTFGSAIFMQKIADSQKIYFKENRENLTREDKAKIKKKNNSKRKTLLILTLILNFGILCVFKYSHFALEQFNNVISLFGAQPVEDTMKFIIPLGISFYTFQSMGYLADVYWNKISAEKNFLKLLLFVSFFPQITQGPISSFEQLGKELFEEHKFSYKNYSWGIQRMMWGFFKKMVIADTLSPWVYDVFENYAQYSGISTLIGAFMYSVLIYADFSGYMDIVCGFCEVLGIKLTENFDRPYFSKSIAEYWRRWHISLGVWFKSYIYYPIAVSGWNKKLGKFSQKKLGKTFGKTVPASVALVVVWLTTGLWHGASMAYVAWGGVNGLFIILSLWLEPLYDKCKSKLKIRENATWFRAFQTIRTFVLVTFIKVLPEVGTLSEGFGLWKNIFTSRIIPDSWQTLLPFIDNIYDDHSLRTINVVIFGTILIFITSMIQRKQPIRQFLGKFPLIVKIAVFVVMFFLIVYFGIPASGNAGGFMYAQF